MNSNRKNQQYKVLPFEDFEGTPLHTVSELLANFLPGSSYFSLPTSDAARAAAA